MAVEENVVSALRGFVRAWLEFDPSDKTKVADIDDVRAAAQRMHRVLPKRQKRRRALEQAFAMIDVQGGHSSRTRHGMAGIRVTVEQFDNVLEALHHHVVNAALRKHRAHRDGAIGDALRHRHKVWGYAEILRR